METFEKRLNELRKELPTLNDMTPENTSLNQVKRMCFKQVVLVDNLRDFMEEIKDIADKHGSSAGYNAFIGLFSVVYALFGTFPSSFIRICLAILGVVNLGGSVWYKISETEFSRVCQNVKNAKDFMLLPLRAATYFGPIFEACQMS
ncbi:hypothetical protein EON65_20805 [archaeon]|nr:MAG: hypothetical protein EON65_20805 [archaeon]